MYLYIKKSINFGLNRDKKNSYNKNLEKILSKARNHKTISVQKLKKKIKMKIEEKEKIIFQCFHILQVQI